MNGLQCAKIKKNQLPWVEKYRPQTLNDVVHHQDILHLLRVFMTTKDMPNLFFYGPPGTGKTSTILSCANEIYGKHSNTMVLHLNASDERGIDVVRKQIIQFVSTCNIFGGKSTLSKMVILDEADSMSHHAQIALRDVMLEYDTLFCFIGNYQFSFQPELQSRVIKLLFTPIPQENAIALGKNILQKEGYSCADSVLVLLYSEVFGDMRQFINLLQVIVMRLASKLGNVTELKDDMVHTIMHKWDNQKSKRFVEHDLKSKTMSQCYKNLKQSIVVLQENTISNWLQELFFVLHKKTQHISIDSTDTMMQVLEFYTNMAHLQYAISQVLQPDIQLYALVSYVHEYYQKMFC